MVVVVVFVVVVAFLVVVVAFVVVVVVGLVVARVVVAFLGTFMLILFLCWFVYATTPSIIRNLCKVNRFLNIFREFTQKQMLL